MFIPSEIQHLKRYVQSIINNPRSFDKQKFITKDGFIWCDDWRIIEILKYLFNGREMYMNDPPPNRLKNNPLWSKEAIMKEADEIVDEYKTAEDIVSFLQQKRNSR